MKTKRMYYFFRGSAGPQSVETGFSPLAGGNCILHLPIYALSCVIISPFSAQRLGRCKLPDTKQSEIQEQQTPTKKYTKTANGTDENSLKNKKQEKNLQKII